MYVYMLQCRDGTLYTGWTDDLLKRVRTHQRGRGARYTRSRLPVRLCYAEEVSDRSSALRRERVIKSFTREDKERLISSAQNILATLDVLRSTAGGGVCVP